MSSSYDYENQATVRGIISIVACTIIGLILLFAGIGKLANFGSIPGTTEWLDKFIPDFLLTPDTARFIGLIFIPWILPVVESIIGLCLIIGIWPRLMAIVFLPLVIGFLANNSYAIASGIDQYPTCECFGIWEVFFGGLTPMQSLYIDLGMFILAIIIIIVHPLPFFSHHFWINRAIQRNKI